MSPILATFIQSALIPAAVVTGAVFLTGGLREPLKSRVQALLLAAGFIVGHYLLLGRLGFPPSDVAESVSYAALAAAAFVWIYPQAHQAPYMVRALFVLALGALVLWPLRQELKTDMGLRNAVAFFCLGLGIWSIFERNVQRLNLLSLLGLPLIAASCLSFTLLFGASASFSQMVQILCALLGGLFVLSLLWPGKISRAAIAPFASLFLVLIMAAGHFSLNINPWKMVILCIPFVFIWTRSWYPFIPKNPVVEFLILAIMSLLPLAYLMWDSFVAAGPLY
jgi:hypothetical protein